MDVSPKTLREVEFREKMRGYHPEDVDQFLERVAAGIEVLQDRLRQAIERAQRAEQAATEAGGNDDALRRTLLLAQRTADLAVQEAREQAARIVAGAEQQSQAMLGDAEQRVHALVTEAEHRAQSVLGDSERLAQSMVSEAEQRARRGHEDALVEVRAELAKLEATRQRLHIDVDAMTRWVAEHRGQLRAALQEALTMIEQIDVTPPPASGVPYPLESQPAVAAVSQSSGAGSPPAVAAAPAPSGDVGTDTPWAPPASPVVSTPAAPPVPLAGPVVSTPAAPPAPPAGPVVSTPAAPPAPLAGPALIPSGWAREDTRAWPAPEPDGGATDEGGDSDPYFAELRRAISDHDPLGPRAEGDPADAGGGHPASAPEP